VALPPNRPLHLDVSRRERQILEVLYARDRATVAEVRGALPEAPSYSAVRALLRILEEKGHVRHEQDGPRYVYAPTIARDSAKRSALRHMLRTFFNGSTEQAIAALLDDASSRLSADELTHLVRLIDQARHKESPMLEGRLSS
jgi:BlaI family penicillinase repressor